MARGTAAVIPKAVGLQDGLMKGTQACGHCLTNDWEVVLQLA